LSGQKERSWCKAKKPRRVEANSHDDYSHDASRLHHVSFLALFWGRELEFELTRLLYTYWGEEYIV